jgi:hypothetical protein
MARWFVQSRFDEDFADQTATVIRSHGPRTARKVVRECQYATLSMRSRDFAGTCSAKVNNVAARELGTHAIDRNTASSLKQEDLRPEPARASPCRFLVCLPAGRV